MFKLNKQKYKAVFLIREYGSLRYKSKKRFNPLRYKGIIKYKKNPYNPILDKPTYVKGLTSLYAFEIDGKQITIIDDKTGKKQKVGTQINVEYNENDKDAHVKDLMYANQVIRQVFQSLEKRAVYLNWIHLALAIGTSLLAGWILGSYIPIGVV